MRLHPVAFAGLMPHAPVLVPGVGHQRLVRVAATVAAMRDLSQRIVASRPDSLVVLSPHSPPRPEAFGVWRTDPLSGSFEVFGSARDSLALPLDHALADAIEQQAAERRLRTWRIQNCTLDHGAMVPLYYLVAAGWHGPTVVVGIVDLDPGSMSELGRAIARAAAGLDRRIAVLASGDMSHRLTVGSPCGYHPAGSRFDRRFIELVRSGALDDLLQLDGELRDTAAEDVVSPTRTAMAAAEDQRTGRSVLSYEGPFGVGYTVAVLYSEQGPRDLLADMAAGRAGQISNPAELPQVARCAVTAGFQGGPEESPFAAGGLLAVPRGVFVSVHAADDELRGCRGSAIPCTANVVASTWLHARQAAFDDSRFEPVMVDELPQVRFSVSVLSELTPVSSAAELDPARYGILVASSDRARRGLLLPGIASIDSAAKQLRLARMKAEIAPHEQVTIQRFTTEVYAEALPLEGGYIHAH